MCLGGNEVVTALYEEELIQYMRHGAQELRPVNERIFNAFGIQDLMRLRG